MLVKYWMKKDVITIDVNDSMHQAISQMKQHKISMLPVVKNGKVVGVLTDRDVKRASASDATSLEIHELIYLLSQIQIKEIMTTKPVIVPPNYTLEETAAVLLKNNISGVPVLDGDHLVGIITESDLFRAFISMSGLEKRGVQFAFRLEDRAGSIKEVTDIIRQYGGRLVSILTSYERAAEGCRNVYVRSYGLDRAVLPQVIEDLRRKATLLYMVDHKEDTRVEYT
ncbi:MAG TPA: CBS and ACT domain-containing protein [Desulfomonilaceae bacterium]|nr:CBS and ACT domain-containing protein [Desulfomonilaceae bacterium]